jgi:hypothetical protein
MNVEHWYHASPHELPPGTVLIPAGGRSPFADVGYARFLDRSGEGVWVSPTEQDAFEWRSVMEEDAGVLANVYEVSPHGTPEVYDSEEDEGWIVDRATVIRKVFDAHTGRV